jgi:hypothetical protein
VGTFTPYENTEVGGSSTFVPFDSMEIPEEDSSLKKAAIFVKKNVLDFPENLTNKVIKPFAENIAGQVIGGAGAIVAPAVAGRNYLSSLLATGNPDKAYEAGKSGYDETSNVLSSLYTPSTELGKESLKQSGEILNAILAPPAEFVGRNVAENLRAKSLPESIRKKVVVPESILKAVEPTAALATEFGIFGGLMKGSGAVKKIVKDIYTERQGMPRTPTAEDFKQKQWVEEKKSAAEEAVVEQGKSPEQAAWDKMERYPEETSGNTFKSYAEDLPNVINQERSINEPLAESKVAGEQKYVWQANKEGGQTIGNKEIIRIPTLEDFTKEILPRIQENYYGKGSIQDQYNEMFQKQPEIRISFVDKGDGWKVAKITNAKYFDTQIREKSKKGWVKQVNDFNSPEATAHRNTFDSQNLPIKDLGKRAEASARLAVERPEEPVVPETSLLDKAKGILSSETGGLMLGERGPFYSKLEEVVNTKMRMNMPVEQLRKTAYANGVTVDEFNTVLSGLKGNVTKKQVLDEIADKGMKFETVELGGKEFANFETLPTKVKDLVNDLENEKISSSEFGNKLEKLGYESSMDFDGTLTSIYKKGITPTQYGPDTYPSLNTPGSIPGSYRERFTTAPKESSLNIDQSKIDAWDKVISNTNTPADIRSAAIEAKYNYIDKQNNLQGNRWQQGHSSFSDIQNPIGHERSHLRFKPDENGRIIRVSEMSPELIERLGLEEAKKLEGQKGFIYKFVDELQGPSGDTKWVGEIRGKNKAGEDILDRQKFDSKEEASAWLTKKTTDRGITGTVTKLVEGEQGKMPPSLQSRIFDVLVKDSLSDARRLGVDGVSWTTGKMQVDRYDLSKQLDEVTAVATGEGQFRIDFTTKNGMKDTADFVNATELSDWVGKELAQRILEEVPRSQGGKTYSGLDLEIGGEGLKKLYDETIPGLFGKYGKEEVGSRDLQFEPTVIRQQLKIPGAGPQETILPYTPISQRTPSSFTMYSGIPGDKIADVASRVFSSSKESVKDLWDKATEQSTTLKSLGEGVRVTNKGIQEKILEPEKIMARDPFAKQIFEKASDAEMNGMAFLQRHLEPFLQSTKGIKSKSFSSEQIGKALDGEIDPVVLNKSERAAYDFFKKEYDFLINEAARKLAGSEASYQKVLDLAISKEAKRGKIKDLNPEDKAVYDSMSKEITDLLNGRKISELKGEEKRTYKEIKTAQKEFLGENIKKTLPPGEAEAFDLLTRKISDYLPHIFEKSELTEAFKIEIDEINVKLRTATNKSVVTRLKNRLGMLEVAVLKMEGGGWVKFDQLPKNIQFKFFNERKGKEGYSYDAIKAYEVYVYGLARKMFDEPMLKEVSELYKNVDPEAKPYVKRLIDYYMGYGEKDSLGWLADGITSIEWMRTLGLNPRSAITNLTQRLNTVVMNNEKGKWFSGEKWAALAEKEMLFNREQTNALFAKTGLAREVPKTMMEGTTSGSLEKARAIVGFMFNQVELGNRKHAFMAGYLRAKSNGMAEAAAMKAGIELVHKTQFRYGKLGTSEIMRNPIGRVALQFTSYPLKQAQHLYDLWKTDKVSFLKYVAYAAGINYTMQEMFDTDISNAVGFGVNLGEALKVLDSAANGDERGAMRHLKQSYQSGGGMLPSGLGPFPTSVYKIVTAAGKGKGFEQVKKELTPIVGSRVRQAYLAIKNEENGEYPIINDQNHVQYRLNARQLAQRTLGPKTEKERQETIKNEQERNLELERVEVTEEAVTLMAKGVLENDDKSIDKAIDLMVEYGVDPSSDAILNEVTARLFSKEEVGKIGKKEIYQMQREGDFVRFKDQDNGSLIDLSGKGE